MDDEDIEMNDMEDENYIYPEPAQPTETKAILTEASSIKRTEKTSPAKWSKVRDWILDRLYQHPNLFSIFQTSINGAGNFIFGQDSKPSSLVHTITSLLNTFKNANFEGYYSLVSAKKGYTFLTHKSTNIGFLFVDVLEKFPHKTIKFLDGTSLVHHTLPIGDIYLYTYTGGISKEHYIYFNQKKIKNQQLKDFLAEEKIKTLNSRFLLLSKDNDKALTITGMQPSPKPSQVATQQLGHIKQFIEAGLHRSILFYGSPGTGKQLALDTELPTPNGFIQLKDLKVGDVLFDEQGNETKVLQLHPINYSPEAYKLTFDDGTMVEACADHLWKTWTKLERASKTQFDKRLKGKRRSSYDQSHKRVLPQVRTTKQILNTLKTCKGNTHTNHSIEVCSPIKYSKKEQIIDPYVLGCWLGDGTTDNGRLESADQEILNDIKLAGYVFVRHSHKKKSKSNQYRIGDLVSNSANTDRKISLLRKQLRDLKLLNNKHIPDNYLYGSVEQRMALLQGLMDTDGSCETRDGHCEYTSTLPILAKQVYQLLLSLGIKASIHQNESWLYDKRHKDRYRVCFITEKPVFRLIRKLERLPIGKPQKDRNTHRYIVNVEPIPSKPMRCITVDSPSHLFLITRSFIATHNTTLSFYLLDQLNYKTLLFNASYKVGAANIIDYAVDLFGIEAIVIDDFDQMASTNEQLELLENLNRRLKVVIGIANSLRSFHPALLRPGRFDEVVLINELDRECILSVLGEDGNQYYEQVKHWPIAYIQELSKRMRFVAPEYLETHIEDLDERVKNQLEALKK